MPWYTVKCECYVNFSPLLEEKNVPVRLCRSTRCSLWPPGRALHAQGQSRTLQPPCSLGTGWQQGQVSGLGRESGGFPVASPVSWQLGAQARVRGDRRASEKPLLGLVLRGLWRPCWAAEKSGTAPTSPPAQGPVLNHLFAEGSGGQRVDTGWVHVRTIWSRPVGASEGLGP